MFIISPSTCFDFVFEHGDLSHELPQARTLVFFNEFFIELGGSGEVRVNNDGVIEFFEVLEFFQQFAVRIVQLAMSFLVQHT